MLTCIVFRVNCRGTGYELTLIINFLKTSFLGSCNFGGQLSAGQFLDFVEILSFGGQFFFLTDNF